MCIALSRGDTIEFAIRRTTQSNQSTEIGGCGRNDDGQSNFECVIERANRAMNRDKVEPMKYNLWRFDYDEIIVWMFVYSKADIHSVQEERGVRFCKGSVVSYGTAMSFPMDRPHQFSGVENDTIYIY